VVDPESNTSTYCQNQRLHNIWRHLHRTCNRFHDEIPARDKRRPRNGGIHSTALLFIALLSLMEKLAYKQNRSTDTYCSQVWSLHDVFGDDWLLGSLGFRVAEVCERVDGLPGLEVLRHPDGRPLPALSCFEAVPLKCPNGINNNPLQIKRCSRKPIEGNTPILNANGLTDKVPLTLNLWETLWGSITRYVFLPLRRGSRLPPSPSSTWYAPFKCCSVSSVMWTRLFVTA